MLLKAFTTSREIARSTSPLSTASAERPQSVQGVQSGTAHPEPKLRIWEVLPRLFEVLGLKYVLSWSACNFEQDIFWCPISIKPWIITLGSCSARQIKHQPFSWGRGLGSAVTRKWKKKQPNEYTTIIINLKKTTCLLDSIENCY